MRIEKVKKRRISFFVCLFGFALLSGCAGQKLQVTITDGQTETKVLIKSGETVEKALERAEISFAESDVVEPVLDTRLDQSNTEIKIVRCANVTVKEGDNIRELELTGKTVQDALDEAGISLGEHDYLNHDRNANLVNEIS